MLLYETLPAEQANLVTIDSKKKRILVKFYKLYQL